MFMNQFRPVQQDIDRVNILSNEGDIYLAQVVIRGHSEMLEDTKGHAKVFHGVSQLKEYMHPLHVDSYHLIYRPAYDEMIGEGQQYETPLDNMLIAHDNNKHFSYFGL